MPDLASVEDCLIDRLKRSLALAQLLDDKIYEVVAPASIRPPFVTLQEISANDVGQALSGPSATTRSLYQVDVYGDGGAGQEGRRRARQLGYRVREALDGYMGDPAAGDHLIKSVLFENRRDLYEPAELTHRVSLDFVVWSTTPIVAGAAAAASVATAAAVGDLVII